MSDMPKDDLTSAETSSKKHEECIANEEFSALPEDFFSSNPIPTFHQRKHEIFKRLQILISDCKARYSGRKELATETDECISDLVATLDIAFQYGIKQQQMPNFVVSAASLFHNMQEIVTGSSPKATNTTTISTDTYFWDFCKKFLTAHEKQRFEQLKQTWTKWGRGKSFIRASLNEHSLHRYILTWLSEKPLLCSYYSHWSLLLDEKIANSLPELIKSLDQVLFALTVDKTELNSPIKMFDQNQDVAKEEPVIYAPMPIKVGPKNKGKSSIVERPIATLNSTEDLLNMIHKDSVKREEYLVEEEDIISLDDTLQTDPIEPELEFLREPLPEFKLSSNSLSDADCAIEAKSEASSHCSSKYSNNNYIPDQCNDATHKILEEQLKEVNERCSLLETRVAQLNLENRQLIRRLKKHFEDSGIDPSSSFATNFLITIPNVKLSKSKHGPSSYHEYEIHITMKQNLEHWSLLRRYSDFNKLHKSLLKTHPWVSTVEFPPKKRFGNMNARFVEERRQQLQIYLLNLVETLPQLEACKSKNELQKVFPFLKER
ncbi:sorting nexin-29 [Stomoxys calcitrans]|uniref:Sorting nexin-29 n=1 Tax=Stomoxys calcitrans TaxID=35570 RepID=A0A1I8NNJ0_STOCA|nr:sorting nexin-29 [Stomoxys calcitrans]